MNYRLSTPEERAARKRNRAKRKALKRSARAQKAFEKEAIGNIQAALALLSLDPKEAGLLRYGNPRERRRIAALLEARAQMMLFDGNDHWSVMFDRKIELETKERKLATHELVIVGDRLVNRKIRGFEIW